MVKMKKKCVWKKLFWCSTLFPTNLFIFQPVTALISTTGGFLVDSWQHLLLTTNHNPKSKGDFKEFSEVALYDVMYSGLDVIRFSSYLIR